jgi:hypothetical protein
MLRFIIVFAIEVFIEQTLHAPLVVNSVEIILALYFGQEILHLFPLFWPCDCQQGLLHFLSAENRTNASLSWYK